MASLYLGIDLGSSSVKVSIVDLNTSRALAQATEPPDEMLITAPVPGWAEQDPIVWWRHTVVAIKTACKQLQQAGRASSEIQAIGIAYQMHGLVALDATGSPIRPSIIWCDSRAVAVGNAASAGLGANYLAAHTLNPIGNFTAAKWGWVVAEEAHNRARIAHIMLPGDYLAFRLTGERTTTAGGLSEGIMWDFALRDVARPVLNSLQLSESAIPPLVPMMGVQGTVTREAASETGLPVGIPITYRAGDQPNNAFSLGVWSPGEVATTAGTSGVMYAVADNRPYDEAGRVNTFLHVTDTPDNPRQGVLLCVNGTGSAYQYLRRLLSWRRSTPLTYPELNAMGDQAPIGADGLRIYPFGNGAERMLGNANPGARWVGLDFNRHEPAHLVRATLEGIAFALTEGLRVFDALDIPTHCMRAGEANLFLNPTFREMLASLVGTEIELYDTDGAAGAARGAAIGVDHANPQTAFGALSCSRRIAPRPADGAPLQEAYAAWRENLSL